MKRGLTVMFLICIISISLFLLRQEPLEEKELYLPERDLVDLEEEKVNLWESVGGRDLLLLFIHPEIRSSIEQLTYLESVDPPLTIFYIIMGTFPKEDLLEKLAAIERRDLLLIDRDATFGKRLEVYSIPTLLLFDRTGKLKKRYTSLLTEEDLGKEFP